MTKPRTVITPYVQYIRTIVVHTYRQMKLVDFNQMEIVKNYCNKTEKTKFNITSINCYDCDGEVHGDSKK